MTRKRNKKITALIICAVLLIAIIGLSVYSCTLHVKEDLSLWQNGDYSQFECDKFYGEFLPKYSEYEDSTKEMRFYYQDGGSMNLEHAYEMVCLELTFSEYMYTLAKDSICASYPLIYDDVWENDYIVAVGGATIGDYSINVVDFSISGYAVQNHYSYPGTLPFIAFNDGQKVIRFAVIFGPSRDYFYDAQGFVKYIKNNVPIGW